MKRYMNHTATIGMLAILIGIGAGAPEAFAGDGACDVEGDYDQSVTTSN